MSVVWDVLILPRFGYGRMIEFYLTGVCALTALILIISPQQSLETTALLDIGWTINPRLIAIPFILKAILNGVGLAFNVLDYPYSQALRFSGGLTGFFIWAFLTFKFVFVGPYLLAFPFCLMAMYSSIRIMAFALVNLPRPGSRDA